jgi:hypothetical protein
MGSKLINPPESVDTISAAYLESLVTETFGESGGEVASFNVQRLDRGTSGAQLYEVSIDWISDNGNSPSRLILKLGGGRKEVFFYSDLASHIPLGTPRVLDARILADGRAWLLMEEISDAKDDLEWDEADYKAVLSDMARLHAQFWSRTDLLDDHDWLWRPDDRSLQDLAAARRSDLGTISSSWLPEALPELFGAERLARVSQVLEQPNKVFGPMLAAGTTLVHGDYWFHNIQITHEGRQVLLDWQDPQIWSALLELVYFLNLLLVVGSTVYREALPFPEELMIGWYTDALAEAGVTLPKSVFDEALLAARVWHPLQHWFRQYSYAITQGFSPTQNIRESNPGAVLFLSDTFARWDQDAGVLLGV